MRRIRSIIHLAVLVALPQLAAAEVPEALRDAARKAVVSNPEVQAGWHAFGAAGAEQDAARGNYRPQADVLASIGQERLARPGRSEDDFTHRNATLSLSQMVYDGFLTRSEVARLGYARLVRYYELVDASETAALEALRAYADVMRYRDLTRLAQENYVHHRQTHDQIGDRAGAGVGRRVDLEQASGRLALAESNLLTEVSNLHDVNARYLRIVGEAPRADAARFAPGTSLGALPAMPQEMLRLAFESSPTLNAAIENVRAGESAVEARKAAFQPRVDLRARQSWDRNLEGVRGESRDTVVEAVVSYSLSRGGADQARLRQAAESLNVAKDLREKACRDVRQTLSIAFNDVKRLDEQLAYLDRHQLSIEKAREAYRRQFDIGQRTLLDLLDTENEYFEARRAYVNARYNQIVAQARTLAGMGRLMSALGVARDDLPSPADLGQNREGVDAQSICPPEAPTMMAVDKEALLREAMQAVGGNPPR